MPRLRQLVQAGASPHSFDEAFERTALHYASQHGRCDAVSLLLEYDADPDARDLTDFTPLHLASERGHTNTVNVLLQHGASMMARTSNGSVALHLAAHNNHVETAYALLTNMLEAGYLPKQAGDATFDGLRNNYEMTPMDHARNKGHDALVHMLNVMTAGGRDDERAVRGAVR